MSNNTNQSEDIVKKHLREFVNNVINKDFAKANQNLTSAVKEKIKGKVNSTLQENQ